MTWKWASQGKK